MTPEIIFAKEDQNSLEKQYAETSQLFDKLFCATIEIATLYAKIEQFANYTKTRTSPEQGAVKSYQSNRSKYF